MEFITTLTNIVTAIMSNSDALIASAIALVGTLIVIAMAIPGDQPEKALQGIVNFLSKYSKKPKAE
jgi:hypothetical protein